MADDLAVLREPAGVVLAPDLLTVGDDIEDSHRKQKKLSDVLKVGDTIVYARYGGTEVKIDDQEYLLVGRSDILAVVQK